MKSNILFARFPFGRTDDPDTTDWLIRTALKCKADERIGEIFNVRIDDTPITMSRNRCMEIAKQLKADIICMIDNDMNPDAYHETNPHKIDNDPLARPFWDSTLDFMLDPKHMPCFVAAPYCGPPPHENVYIFYWANFQNDNPNADLRLEQYSRDEAARWTGIVEVGALPTGLILMHTKCLDCLKPPYFKYEWKNNTESEKASTEDVFFTRDLSLAGTKIYCNWDAWAGHWKRKCVGKPRPLSVDAVRQEMRACIIRNVPSNQHVIMVGSDGINPAVVKPEQIEK